jgi:hypothetical protein
MACGAQGQVKLPLVRHNGDDPVMVQMGLTRSPA